MWEKELCRHQGQWKMRGRKCSRHQRRVVKTMVEQIYPCSQWTSMGEQRFTCSPLEQGDAQRRLCPCGKPELDQVPGKTHGLLEIGAHAEANLLSGLVTLWNRPTVENFVKHCSLWEGFILQKFMEDCVEQRKCEKSSPWRERNGRGNMWWTDCNSHSPVPLHCREFWGRRNQEWRRQAGGKHIKIWTHYPTLIWVIIN